MAELLKPIVLHLPDRGACAVDYIDYFDEGQYGPDKPFFVNRYDNFSTIAKQMDMCLALQTTPGAMIHTPSRLTVANKWVEPLSSKNDLFPQRAQYKIRFLLRIKFYGEFAYIDIGVNWKNSDMDTNRLQIVEAKDLTVVNRCWISEKDANAICDMIKKELTYDGTQAYVMSDGVPSIAKSSNEIITAYAAQKLADENKAKEEAALNAALLMGTDEFVLTDGNSLISFN